MDPFYICRCNAHWCCQHFVLGKSWQNEFYLTDGCRISFAVMVVIIIIVFIKASVHHIDIHKYQQYMQYNMSFVAMALIWNISFFNFILFFFVLLPPAMNGEKNMSVYLYILFDVCYKKNWHLYMSVWPKR